MSVYICESVNLNGEASDEASPFSLIQPDVHFYFLPLIPEFSWKNLLYFL